MTQEEIDSFLKTPLTGIVDIKFEKAVQPLSYFPEQTVKTAWLNLNVPSRSYKHYDLAFSLAYINNKYLLYQYSYRKCYSESQTAHQYKNLEDVKSHILSQISERAHPDDFSKFFEFNDFEVNEIDQVWMLEFLAMYHQSYA